jgi:hypothetical protein
MLLQGEAAVMSQPALRPALAFHRQPHRRGWGSMRSSRPSGPTRRTAACSPSTARWPLGQQRRGRWRRSRGPPADGAICSSSAARLARRPLHWREGRGGSPAPRPTRMLRLRRRRRCVGEPPMHRANSCVDGACRGASSCRTSGPQREEAEGAPPPERSSSPLGHQRGRAQETSAAADHSIRTRAPRHRSFLPPTRF